MKKIININKKNAKSNLIDIFLPDKLVIGYSSALQCQNIHYLSSIEVISKPLPSTI